MRESLEPLEGCNKIMLSALCHRFHPNRKRRNFTKDGEIVTLTPHPSPPTLAATKPLQCYTEPHIIGVLVHHKSTPPSLFSKLRAVPQKLNSKPLTSCLFYLLQCQGDPHALINHRIVPNVSAKQGNPCTYRYFMYISVCMHKFQ